MYLILEVTLGIKSRAYFISGINSTKTYCKKKFNITINLQRILGLPGLPYLVSWIRFEIRNEWKRFMLLSSSYFF